MRSKDTILKKEIYDFVNGWKRDYGTSPSLKKIADQMQVSRTTVVYSDRCAPFARCFRASLTEGENHLHGD